MSEEIITYTNLLNEQDYDKTNKMLIAGFYSEKLLLQLGQIIHISDCHYYVTFLKSEDELMKNIDVREEKEQKFGAFPVIDNSTNKKMEQQFNDGDVPYLFELTPFSNCIKEYCPNENTGVIFLINEKSLIIKRKDDGSETKIPYEFKE